MPIYTYTKPGHDLSFLHDQLIAAGLRPELVQGTDDEIRLLYGADPPGGKAAVDAMVAAHDAAQRPPDPLTTQEDPITQRLARFDDATPLTVAEVRALLRFCLLALRFLVRRLRGLRE